MLKHSKQIFNTLNYAQAWLKHDFQQNVLSSHKNLPSNFLIY